MFGSGVGVGYSVDDGDGGKDRQYPEDRSHGSPVIEEGADEDEDDALGALHEADLALADEGLGTARV